MPNCLRNSRLKVAMSPKPAANARSAILRPACRGSLNMRWTRASTGGYARYVAICPPDAPVGTTIGGTDAPLPKFANPLRWSAAAGTRVR
jgi:hypothetical protein